MRAQKPGDYPHREGNPEGRLEQFASQGCVGRTVGRGTWAQGAWLTVNNTAAAGDRDQGSSTSTPKSGRTTEAQQTSSEALHYLWRFREADVGFDDRRPLVHGKKPLPKTGMQQCVGVPRRGGPWFAPPTGSFTGVREKCRFGLPRARSASFEGPKVLNAVAHI